VLFNRSENIVGFLTESLYAKEILGVLEKRLKDTGKQWRHVMKVSSRHVVISVCWRIDGSLYLIWGILGLAVYDSPEAWDIVRGPSKAVPVTGYRGHTAEVASRAHNAWGLSCSVYAPRFTSDHY
jgi:hypothetical protein